MTLEEITNKVKSLAASHGGQIGAIIKFSFNEGGTILLDDTQSPATVTNDDGAAGCTVKISMENFIKLMNGEMNAMGAYMMGRLKIDGDMGVAMKLANLF